MTLAGEQAAKWQADFGALVGTGRVSTDLSDDGHERRRLGLAVIAPGSAVKQLDLPALIRKAARLLAPSGMLLLLVHNRLAHRWSLGGRRHAAGTIFGLRRALRAAGLEYNEFLAVPHPDEPEEFVRTGTSDAAAVDAGPFRWARALMRRGGWLHRGFLYAASPPGAGLRAMVRDLASGMGCLDMLAEARVTRFDLRDRGTLVLLLEGGGSKASVCRVAGGPESVELLEHATNALARLHRQTQLERDLGSMIPRPIASGRVRGHIAHLETRLPGTIAWRIAGHQSLESRTFDDLCQFLAIFNGHTAQATAMDENLVARLLAPVPERPLPRVAPPLERDLAVLCEMLRSRLLGRKRFLVWGHGDFGYGNALADAATGACTGVMDWDTAREHELVGVDLVNFLVQRHRILRRLSLTGALRHVGEILLKEGPRAIDPRLQYAERLGLDREAIHGALGLAVLRFFQRDARYPAVLAREQDDLTAAAAWCVTALRDPPGGV